MAKYKPLIKKLFNNNCQLIDEVDDIFELDLALWEHETLSKKELIQRSAYFKKVENQETIHFQECNLQNLEEIHKNSSFRTKIFFLNGKYSTGYATHGLFPYRGKFHPQMIRALLNVLNIKKENKVLDPMGGSGTLATEANLLGINAISVDVSPFCGLMSRVKTFSLDLDSKKLEQIAKNTKQIFEKLNQKQVPEYFLNNKGDEEKTYYEIILLAFLDAMGFANRSNSSLRNLFPRVLERYIKTIVNFQKAKQDLNLSIGKTEAIQGSVLNLTLQDNSVDAIITSPPYSFAIDYLKNDQSQLEYLGYNLNELRTEMIGLQGRGVGNKLELYFEKMEQALKEISRVSKKGAPTVIIIGTNDIQTGGVNLQEKIIELAKKQNLKFDFEMLKPIRGLQNTMKNESILFFNNVK